MDYCKFLLLTISREVPYPEMITRLVNDAAIPVVWVGRMRNIAELVLDITVHVFD